MPDLLAIFDVDGTLVDSQHVIHATMAGAFVAAGRTPPARPSVARLVGLSLPRMVEALAPDGDEESWNAIVAEYRLGFAAAMREGGEPPLYDGAADCLTRLEAAGIRLAIATGKSQRGLDRLLDALGWGGRFVSAQTADLHPSKPHPAMLRRVLSDAATAAGGAVMIGDTGFDMEMARAAGVAAIGVGWGYHDAPVLERAGAERVAEDFAALTEHLLERAR